MKKYTKDELIGKIIGGVIMISLFVFIIIPYGLHAMKMTEIKDVIHTGSITHIEYVSNGLSPQTATITFNDGFTYNLHNPPQNLTLNHNYTIYRDSFDFEGIKENP